MNQQERSLPVVENDEHVGLWDSFENSSKASASVESETLPMNESIKDIEINRQMISAGSSTEPESILEMTFEDLVPIRSTSKGTQ